MCDEEGMESGQLAEGKRIGIFGGSFDPVHDGHVHLAGLAKEAALLDEVWFLPCRVSPHKEGEPPASATARVEWLKVVVRTIPWAKIETLELELQPPSYSYRTLETLVQRYPGNQWFWIMGGDQWAALDRWREPDLIAELASFIVLSRDGVEPQDRSGYRLERVLGEHPASSTEIRAAIVRGDRGIEYLHPEVESLMLKDQS